MAGTPVSRALILAFLLCGTALSFASHVPHICHGDSSEECKGAVNQVGPVASEPIPALIPSVLQASDFDVKFILHNYLGEEIAFDFDTIQRITNRFHPDAEWKILIHGFLNSQVTEFPVNVQKAYIERMNRVPNTTYNVVVFDWSKGACASISLRPYDVAARNVETAGFKLGSMLQRLNRNYKVSFDKIHLIGHSLGSHVAGNAARRVFDITGELLWRISALDPAGPYFWRNIVFQKHKPYPRLRRNRVKFLDVYHTSETFGGEEEMGDVDFYVNGGLHQPSCDFTVWGIRVPFIPEIFFQVCSHNYATTIFAKTINDNTLRGCAGCYNYKEFQNNLCQPCEDEPVMGEHVTEHVFDNGYPMASGTVYVDTEKDPNVGYTFWKLLDVQGNLKQLSDGLKGLCFLN